MSDVILCFLGAGGLIWLFADLWLQHKKLKILGELVDVLKNQHGSRTIPESNSPSQGVSRKGPTQLVVADLAPEAIAPSLKRPPKPPSSSGPSSRGTD